MLQRRDKKIEACGSDGELKLRALVPRGAVGSIIGHLVFVGREAVGSLIGQKKKRFC